MKKLSFLLAGVLLLCGCQRVLIQPDRVTGIYVQADFETARTAVSGSLQDDVLEVLSSLSFGSAEEGETPEGVRIDVEEGDGMLSFYCGDDAMIGVRGAGCGMRPHRRGCRGCGNVARFAAGMQCGLFSV